MARQYYFISGVWWRNREAAQRVVNMLHNIKGNVGQNDTDRYEVQEVHLIDGQIIFKVAFSSERETQIKVNDLEIAVARDFELAFKVGYNFRTSEVIKLVGGNK